VIGNKDLLDIRRRAAFSFDQARQSEIVRNERQLTNNDNNDTTHDNSNTFKPLNTTLLLFATERNV
jgi:hypothetical protein